MNTTMMTLDEQEMLEIEGGNPFAIFAVAVSAYTQVLGKMESNPEHYTFLMDWYYSQD